MGWRNLSGRWRGRNGGGVRIGRTIPIVFVAIVAGAGVIVAGGGGCTNANVALNDARVPLENRRLNHTRAAIGADERPVDSHGYFVGLALSGGGSRSANFSAACMFQLERVGVLQHVDYISSVSGGSLAAAYYCVNDNGQWNPGNVQRRLTHSFAADLINQTFFMPWNWFALTFTDWDRSDLLANSFRDVLYSRGGRTLTYADLRADRPRLLINATDLQSGRRFVFDNEAFDLLNSDLSRYPLAYAVTASSAVPVLLHQVTLRDYSTSFPQYRHLLDGGVTDNLGVLTLLDTYAGQIAAARGAGRPDPFPRGAIFIVVDAHTQFDVDLSSKGDVGWFDSLKTALGLTSTSLLNRVSLATMADIIVRSSKDDMTAVEIRRKIQDLNENGYMEMRDRGGHDVRVVYLSLEQVNALRDLPFAGFRESVNNIGTYFNIDQAEAYHLYEAGELLVRQRFEDRLRQIAQELNAR